MIKTKSTKTAVVKLSTTTPFVTRLEMNNSTSLMVSNHSPKLRTNLSLDPFLDNICISFLLSHLFSGYAGLPWMEEHAKDTSCISGQKSIRALGALYFGRIHHQDEIAEWGHELYGQALVTLNQELQDVDAAWSIAVMKSATVLEFYEVSHHS